MAPELIIVGVLNLIFGLMIILIPKMLRILVGGYFLLSGLLFVLTPLL